MPISFNELADSPTFTVTAGGAQAERRGLIDWSDVNEFAEEVLPASVATGSGAGQVAGAGFPGRPALRVTQLVIEPFPQKIVSVDGSGVANYNHALATLNYSTVTATFGGSVPSLPVEPLDRRDPVPFLQHQVTVGGEWITIPGETLEWANYASEDVNEDVQAGVFVPILEHQVSWPRVVSPPFQAMRDTIGKVNSTTGTFATGTFAKETLLFLGAELSREIMSNGSRAWNVTYRFSERRVVSSDSADTVGQDPDLPGGWNHFYGGDAATASGFYPGFYRLQRTTDEPIYALTSFTPLFQTG